MGKEKTGIVLLILFALLSGCKTATLSTRATLTPITVNTLSAFYSPAPSLTYLPTSTPDRRPTNTFIPTTTYNGTLTFTPSLIPTAVNPPIRNPKIEFPSNLVLDEWELAENSQLARGFFHPLQGTEEEILEKYKGIDIFDNFPSPLIQGYYNKVMLNGYELIVKEEVIDSKSFIHVLYDGEEISRVDAGRPFATPNVWGLWTYQNHWIMEYINLLEDPYGRSYMLGNIIWDGESFNSKFGYQESFGLTAIDGRILYFFKRNNRIGISYDGKEYDLDYELVHHYKCCEIGFYINPTGIGTGLQRTQSLSFFSERNGIKYFVVIWAK